MLPALTSFLLNAVTAHLTLDVMPLPLLPLAVFATALHFVAVLVVAPLGRFLPRAGERSTIALSYEDGRGVLRDVLVNEVPRALSDHRPYALWAFAGGWLYVVLLGAALPPWLALSITVVATAGLRVLSVSARNIPRVAIRTAADVNALDVLEAKRIVLVYDAVAKLEERLS